MLRAVHNRYLRRLAGTPNYGPGGVTNAGVYRLTSCPSLRKHLLQRRMEHLGHVARMPDSCITKHMLFASGISGSPLHPHARPGHTAPGQPYAPQCRSSWLNGRCQIATEKGRWGALWRRGS